MEGGSRDPLNDQRRKGKTNVDAKDPWANFEEEFPLQPDGTRLRGNIRFPANIRVNLPDTTAIQFDPAKGQSKERLEISMKMFKECGVSAVKCCNDAMGTDLEFVDVGNYNAIFTGGYLWHHFNFRVKSAMNADEKLLFAETNVLPVMGSNGLTSWFLFEENSNPSFSCQHCSVDCQVQHPAGGFFGATDN